MLFSIALILLMGMALGWICKKCRLPSLLGMLLTGILLGPSGLGLLDPSILQLSADIRKIALLIILTRAGLGLDLSGLRKIGRPALLMCFVPASMEILGFLLLGPRLLGLTLLESAILGSVIAAVSPAVVVPRMVKLMEEHYGTAEGIPQLILAGASVDDVYVIVLFSTFTGMAQGKGISAVSFINIPISICLGIALGWVIGWLLSLWFTRFPVRNTVMVLILLSLSFLLVSAEAALPTAITFSALIAVMFVGISLRKHIPQTSAGISGKYGKLWVGAEVFLFVLVGATVNIRYLSKVGPQALLLILVALLFRMLGVRLCMTGPSFSRSEKRFSMLAYTPKATVQAAIGGMPLAMGLPCGDTVLTAAVLAIVLTAPLGAFAIDLTYRRWLKKEETDHSQPSPASTDR